MSLFKELYNYRELLKTNVKKDIRGKYKASFLGVLWSFINPLLSVFVYSIVFRFLLRNDIPNFLIFLIVAIIPWNFFTTVISQGTTCIVGNGGVIKKVYFPRIILPISVATSGLINFFISCFIIFAFLIGSGIGLTWLVLLLPFIGIIQYIMSLGMSLILSAVNVYIRDVEYIVGFILSLAFYATPILYDASTFSFPSYILFILNLNPMTHLVNVYRDILYYQQLPQLSSIIVLVVFSVTMLVLGVIIFQKLQKRFAEEL